MVAVHRVALGLEDRLWELLLEETADLGGGQQELLVERLLFILGGALHKLQLRFGAVVWGLDRVEKPLSAVKSCGRSDILCHDREHCFYVFFVLDVRYSSSLNNSTALFARY